MEKLIGKYGIKNILRFNRDIYVYDSKTKEFCFQIYDYIKDYTVIFCLSEPCIEFSNSILSYRQRILNEIEWNLPE